MTQSEWTGQRGRAAAIAGRLLDQLGPGPDVSTILSQEGRSFAPVMRGGGGGRRRSPRRRRYGKPRVGGQEQTRERENRLRFRLMERLGLLPTNR